jgi:hypothetical protein
VAPLLRVWDELGEGLLAGQLCTDKAIIFFPVFLDIFIKESLKKQRWGAHTAVCKRSSVELERLRNDARFALSRYDASIDGRYSVRIVGLLLHIHS